MKWTYALVPVACIALSGCGMGKGKEPTGQVVATVDGDEITVTELRAEMAGVNVSDPKIRKMAEQQALQSIINRKIIAAEAAEQKLDKTPDFALQEARAMDSLRANALQKKIVDSVPAPTREEANKFIAENPHVFAERKIFAIDQIRMQRPANAALMKDFQPLKTLEEVETMLKAKGIPYQRGTDSLDAIGSNPALVDEIARLPPNEVFVLPTGQMVLINTVRGVRVQPFTGEPAVKYATNVLKARRTQEALQRQFGGMIKAAQTTVRYNKAYEPPKPPAAKKPAAAATPKA